jgi:beta-1,4-mannosyl-glycoprotein beta-1,4-N-acetylglucosaminyltransferase
MKIIDCFSYFNEKEMLELRINLLYDHVDKFIISDANMTHSGKSKPFTCKDTLKSLGLLKDKIHVIEIDLPSYEQTSNAWVRERMQRNIISNYIQSEDVCIISDCDEIINPKFIEYYTTIAQQYPNNILRIPMAFLHGRADLRVCDELGNAMPWQAPFICLKRHLDDYTLSDIRESYALNTHHIKFSDIFITQNNTIEEAGWHFNWMGNQDRLKLKKEAFLHYDEVSLIKNYHPIVNEYDCLGRQNHILHNYSFLDLPQKIFTLQNVFKFLLPNFKVNPITEKTNLGENWFTFPELYKNIVENCSNGSKLVEVGCWKGRSSIYMATMIANAEKNIDFYCIDTFEGSVEHKNLADLKNIYDIFLSNIDPVKKYIKHIKNSSINSSYKFENDSLDFVFIDASHEYEEVKQDILSWLPKVKKNGVLAGHDYHHDDVRIAVNEILGECEISEDCFIYTK